MKLKLKSKAFLQKHSDRAPSVTHQMWARGGKYVTAIDPSSSKDFRIKQDKGEWYWAAWMFEDNKKLKKLREPKEISLMENAGGHDSATIHPNGSVTVGCTRVPFVTLEQLYKAAVKERNRK